MTRRYTYEDGHFDGRHGMYRDYKGEDYDDGYRAARQEIREERDRRDRIRDYESQQEEQSYQENLDLQQDQESKSQAQISSPKSEDEFPF